MIIEEGLSKQIVAAFYDVFNDTGDGYLEVLYQRCLVIALRARGLRVETEVPMTVRYLGQPVGDYRVDLLVERKVIIECKAGDRLHLAHEHQLLNYLTSTGLPLGYLFHFGAAPTFKRFVNQQQKTRRRKLTISWKDAAPRTV